MPRYSTTGIPQQLAAGSALGLSAFFPHFNRLAGGGAQSYKGQVSGNPGWAGIRVDNPQQASTVDGFTMPLMGTARSSDAPNMIYPTKYYDNPAAQGPDGDRYYPGAGMPVQIYRPGRPQDTTMIPVPATDLRAVYQARAARLQNPAGQAGDNVDQGALFQPAALVRWAKRKVGPVTWSSDGG